MILATLASSIAFCVPGSLANPIPQGKPKLEIVLAAWDHRYRKGKLEIGGMARKSGKDEKFYGHGHLPPGRPAFMDHGEALDHLLEEALSHQTIEVLEEILDLATVGLGEDKLPPQRLATSVRIVCLNALGKFSETGSLDFMQRIASGDQRAWGHRRWSPLIQAAALQALGRSGRSVFRPIIEKQLGSESLVVRTAAGDALGSMQLAPSLAALTRSLQTAEDSHFCRTLVLAAEKIIDAHKEDLGSAEIRSALAAAIGKLGRSDWHSDLTVVRMLEKYRTLPAIPALIGILERFTKDRHLVASNKLSGILQHRAHELLSSMTGALIPKDRPDLWREFWQREHESFALAPVPHQRGNKPRTHAGFFGIPVIGQRLVYVIDISGSMNLSHVPSGQTRSATPRNRDTRLQLAKHELRSSVSALPVGTEFDLIFFSDKASRWHREFTGLTKRSLRSMSDRLEKLPASGGTNIYGALLSAMTLRSSGHKRNGGLPAEEIFLLSDGQPSTGLLIDPDSILAAIAEANRQLQIRINTIFIGRGGSRLLRKLAEQSGGSYVEM